jgi:uncharacterized integral membrane protein
VVVLALVLLIVFMLQNTDPFPVKFLFFDAAEVPSVVLILVMALGGFLVGYFLAATRRRAPRVPKEPVASTPPAQPDESKLT